MRAFVVLMFICILGTGCQNAELERARMELESSRAAQKKAEALAQLAQIENTEADRANQALASDGKRLVHVVWFKLKDDATDSDYDALVAELNKLTGIDEVQNFEVGRFHDLGDERALEELDVVMQMGFNSEADYHTYQKHPVHVQLKSDVGQFLGGPPVTYDYWSE